MRKIMLGLLCCILSISLMKPVYGEEKKVVQAVAFEADDEDIIDDEEEWDTDEDIIDDEDDIDNDHTITSGDWSYSFLDDNESICIEAYEGNETELVIPSTIDGHAVKALGYCSFGGEDSGITSVKIPYGVTQICGWAFSGSENLVSVEIPNSVKVIDPYVFEDCKKLLSVKIPKGVKDMGYSTFSGCESLRQVEIPDSVTTIGADTFSGCKSLLSIEIPNSVTTIEEFAFQGCSSLKKVDLPKNVTRIDYRAFSDCSSLERITIRAVNPKLGKEILPLRSKISIYGYKGTTKDYARKYNYTFVSLGNVCTIRFDANGGDKLSKKSMDVPCKSKYGALPSATRKGYYFSGWYTARTKGKKVSQNTIMGTKDVKLYARWGKVTKPKAVSVTYLKKGNCNFTIRYKKQSGVKGYEIKYSTKKNMSSSKTVKTKKTEEVVDRLEKNKNYCVQVRAYKEDSRGSKIYGSWSKVKKTA